MKHSRALLALAVSVSGLTCGAFSQGALAKEGGPAHEFTGSVTQEVSAASAGQQEFDFEPLNVKCRGAKPFKGAPKTTFPALKFVVLVKFGKCKTAPLQVGKETHPGSKATFNQALEIEYHAGGEPNAEIKNLGAIQISIPDLECTISLAAAPPATDQATYTNVEEKAKSTKKFPLGVQHMVQIDNTFEKITWSASGGVCGQLKKHEGKEAEYFGNLRAELKSGDLGWE
jgi:hypothetical protein